MADAKTLSLRTTMVGSIACGALSGKADTSDSGETVGSCRECRSEWQSTGRKSIMAAANFNASGRAAGSRDKVLVMSSVMPTGT